MYKYTLALLLISIVVFSFTSCTNSPESSSKGEIYIEFERLVSGAHPETNMLYAIQPKLPDGSLNAVVEIPAGSNQKWEVDKVTGQIVWERIHEDSLRTVRYLPYPANYGYIPRTLLPVELGGDGDPLDVFILGPSAQIGAVLNVKVIGGIHMIDDGEQDDKLIAVDLNSWFADISSLNELEEKYPGIVDILQTFLKNYKGPDNSVIIEGLFHLDTADKLIDTSIRQFQIAS